LEARREALDAANPAAILARGYAMVRRGDDGARITSAAAVPPGTALTIQFHDGEIDAYTNDPDAIDKDNHAGYQRPLF